MSEKYLSRTCAHLLAISAIMFFVPVCIAQQSANEKLTHEPVYHTTRNNDSSAVPATNAAAVMPVAPIDRALNIASEGLEYIRRDIHDYTATLIKRERINGVVGEAEFMSIKVRNRKEESGVPLSIYMKFLKPSSVKDREVIWVEGENDGKLIAHEGSGLVTMTVRLDPDGFIAMRGNRYPISECGIENLVFRLIEKGTRDKELGNAEVAFYPDTKINGRKCTLIQVTHPDKRPEFDFHVCRIFIDDELQIPIRYAAYGWPETEGGKPTLDEEYTYLDVAVNVGLTDADFDSNNSAYNFK